MPDKLVAVSGRTVPIAAIFQLPLRPAARHELIAPVASRVEIEWHEAQPLRDAAPEFNQPRTFPCLRTRPVDLEHRETGGDLRLALCEANQACPSTRSSMKQARATMEARKGRANSRSLSARRRQPSSGLDNLRPM